MEIQIQIGGPLADAVNNLSAAITNILAARAEMAAAAPRTTPTPTKPAKGKLATVVNEPSVEPPMPAAPRTIDEVKTLAALKAKRVGATVIKGLIADTGSAQIADIADPHVLASLAANLDAL